ncbi:MAG: anti-sigma factor domain-containing protein [Elainellaceae cyanobacterium]
MSGSVSPEQLKLLMAGYVLCDLSPEEAAALEQLLSNNPNLIREIDQMQQALEMTFPSEAEPPAHLRSSILSAYDIASHLTPDASASRQEFRQTPRREGAQPTVLRPRWWIRSLGAAAAVVILGLSISNYVLWRSLQAEQTEMQSPNLLTFSLQPTEEDISGSVRVVVNPTRLDATLDADNLPPLEEGNVYALWTVVAPNAPVTTDEKNAILTDVFTVNAQGHASKQVTLPSVFHNLGWVEAIAITQEDADAPQAHRASPILIERL